MEKFFYLVAKGWLIEIDTVDAQMGSCFRLSATKDNLVRLFYMRISDNHLLETFINGVANELSDSKNGQALVCPASSEV